MNYTYIKILCYAVKLKIPIKHGINHLSQSVLTTVLSKVQNYTEKLGIIIVGAFTNEKLKILR